MQPNTLTCGTALGKMWIELAHRNGLRVAEGVDSVVVGDRQRDYQVRFWQDENGRYTFLLQDIRNNDVLGRIELMSLASDADCPVAMSAVEFEAIFRCPVGSIGNWRSSVAANSLSIIRNWGPPEIDNCIDGILTQQKNGIRFSTGIAFCENSNSFCEFIALAPLRKLIFNKNLDRLFMLQKTTIVELGGELMGEDKRE